jgi:hypothetical protein
MATPRASITLVLIACLVAAPCAGTVFAAEEERAPNSSADITSVTSPESVARMMMSLHTGDAAANTPRELSVPAWHDTSTTTELTQRDAFAGQVYRDPPIRIDRRNRGSIAALMLGSIATITGAALLIYANRPECSTSQFSPGGCGYGTKVIGGAVLTGGVVGLMVGALTWR